MKNVKMILMISALTVTMPIASNSLASTNPSTANAVKKAPYCPKEGTIVDGTCYMKTGKKPVISSDPTAKPICYPGTYIKTKTGYSCSVKYSDYKNPN
jgi:hypothetical protein